MKKRKTVKVKQKTKSYRFFNCGVQYICTITYPVDIEDYKVKEVFDNTFVGKRDMSVITKPLAFNSLSQNIDYSIVPVKEVN